MAMVGLSPAGTLNVYNSAGSTSLVVDVDGYFVPASSPLGSSGDGYHPVTPTRICDTRPANPSGLFGLEAQCNSGSLAAGVARPVQISGVGPVPSGATAAVLNLTVIDPSGPGYAEIYPASSATPAVSDITFGARETLANSVVVALPASGVADVLSSAATDVAIDVQGYFTLGPATGDELVPVTPYRAVDTRSGSGCMGLAGSAMPGNRTISILDALTGFACQSTSTPVIPAGADAVVANLTAVATSASSPSDFVAAFSSLPSGSDGAAPVVSTSDIDLSVNDPSYAISNLVVEPLSPSGMFDIYNFSGTIDLVVDIFGFFAPPLPAKPVDLLTGSSASFVPNAGPSQEPWRAVKATTATLSYDGEHALAIAPISPAPSGTVPVAAASPAIRATAGLVYGGWASVSANTSETVLAQPMLAFYSASGATLAGAYGQDTSADSSRWTSEDPAVAVAPPGSAYVVLYENAYTAAYSQQLYLSDAWITASAPSSSPVVGPLHVVGNAILQSDGDPLVMRGFVLYGLQHSADPAGIPLKVEIDQAKAWGANVVRVSLGEQLWLKTSCYYSPSYAGVVNEVVQEITSLGMVALLDLHLSSIGACGTPGPQMMADDPGSITFWKQVASQYKDNPLVAFGLFNEPQRISESIWLDGGYLANAKVPYQAAGMQQLYDAVRSTGAKNLVIVSGLNFANDFPTTLVAGSNIAYGVHVYTCPVDPPPNCSSSAPYDPAPVLDGWVLPSLSVPVVVSEFGWPSANSGTYNSNVVSFADDHGWGWIGFAFSRTTDDRFDLLEPTSVPGFYVPSPAAMPLVASLNHLGYSS